MDRATFRRIILAARIKRREKFEETLQEMSIFAALTASQSASIADCLELEIFEVQSFLGQACCIPKQAPAEKQ